ncbi:MAG: hypothetical protein GYA87_02765 [Christensenellaceae bacterium]|nr:hypothetical protein [Christensenellaceae bacterium]
MKMKNNNINDLLKNLPETIDELIPKASSNLKSKIIEKAYFQNSKKEKFKFNFKLIPSLSSFLVIATIFVVIIGLNNNNNLRIVEKENTVPLLFESHTSSANKDLKTKALMTDEGAVLDKAVIVEDYNLPAFQSIWNSDITPFPFINYDDKVFRLIDIEENFEELCNNEVAIIEKQENYPSFLSIPTSNFLQIGTPVFTNNKFKDTFVIAKAEGKTKVFQRVSFGGIALINNESFDDTFLVQDSVKSLDLSGIGKIDDESKAKELISILNKNVKYINANDGNTFNSTLIVELNNGIKLQLLVKDYKIAACGTYSCPEFFEKFYEYIKK